MSKEEKEKRTGSHKDNNLSHTQKVMKDNDIPFFYSEDDEEDKE